MCWRLAHLVSELMQWCEIIENPERPSVRGHDQVLLFDDQIVDRHYWQVPLQRLPGSPIVKGDIDPRFRTGIEQTTPPWVLTDDARKIVVRDATGDRGPGSTVVVGLVQIRLEVVELIACGRDIGRGRIVRRGFNHTDHGPLRSEE